MTSHTIALQVGGPLSDDDKRQLEAAIAAGVAGVLAEWRDGDSGAVKATFVREERSMLPDDPHAVDVDRLLLAFWIQPDHARQLGFDTILDVVRAMRWDLHRLPMVQEDWGTERTLREELAKAIDGAVDALREADEPSARCVGALELLVEAQTWLADPDEIDDAGALLAEYEAEHGVITNEEMAAVRDEMVTEMVAVEPGSLSPLQEVRLWVDVQLAAGADPDLAAEHLFDLAGSDPHDTAPEIETILNYGHES